MTRPFGAETFALGELDWEAPARRDTAENRI